MGSQIAERRIDPLLIDERGHRACLMGNEAVVRGALEAGVAFASGYPGTPSSEVTDSFARIADQAGVVFEYSVNEKVALETAFGACLAGARAICAMKHLGLMVAGDPLSTIPYIGTAAGLVIVSAGDPSCRTSPNEQDQRHLAPMLHIPMLDPSTPAEAGAMSRFAFELSERSKLPVILRITTRICHTRGVIEYQPLRRPLVTGFARDPRRLVPVPVNARRLRIEIKKRLQVAQEMLRGSGFNRTRGEGPLAVLASGAPAATTGDLLREQDLAGRVRFLALGGVFPLPEEDLVRFLDGVERLLVVEELSPFLEDTVAALCQRRGIRLELLGKRSGHFPEEFEYRPAVIREGLHEALGLGSAPQPPAERPQVAPRPPILCAGCPHRSAYFAARAAFGEDRIYFNDIGCYTLGYGPPLNTADALLCMGASVTMASSVARMTGQRTVAFIGDSTFFHAGMTGLLDAVKEQREMVLVILDNQVTAMTGFQESPTVELSGGEARREISIPEVVKALGVQHLELVDPYDLPASVQAFERARDATGVSVVVVQRACGTYLAKVTGAPAAPPVYEIDHDRCQSCGREARGHRCSQGTTEGYERHMARSRALQALPGQQLGAAEAALSPVAVAPCSAVCPLHICVQGYVGHVASGEYREAWQMIMAKNPLPDVVCRVCHHPCESVCPRAELDEPIAINELKRYVMDWVAAQGDLLYDPPREPEHGRKVAVVGAGPAGLAAAHDLRLRGYGVTLFDAEERPGGLLRTGIPAFRLPAEALERDVKRILELGVEFRGGLRLGEDLSLRELLEQQGHDAVFLGLGAHRGLQLELPGEDGNGPPSVTDALGLLRAIKLGLEPPIGKRVAVVGGGNAAVDAARTVLRRGAEQVTVVYRRRRQEMPALISEIEAAEAEGVQLMLQHQPLSILRGRRAGLEVVRTEPGDPDRSGRRRPVPVGGSETLVPADQVVVAIGQAPDPRATPDGDHDLDREADGSLRVDPETGRTSHERIFAGGDVVWGERTVTWAMAAGQRAAWGIDCALRGPEQANLRPPPPRTEKAEVAAWPLAKRADSGAPRQRPPEQHPQTRKAGFEEVVGTLTEAAARAEADRCLVCGLCGNCRACLDLFGCPAFYLADDGRPQIDPALCTGCGVCADFCPNQAIKPKVTP
jgi:indolepyruvate ferredoxin oxidoreductase alpha subunit